MEPFFYYFVINKALNPSNVKYKRAHINQYSLRGNSKGSTGQNIYNIKHGRNMLWQFFIFMELEPFS